ncbi:peptidoglycan DD-metalloendopeptidase family protein [Ferrovum sp.]|uniref:murein hydrolase activator EnvC family protein n=1 Tax=Ferrovum sp. TaxID=2609467 RepID=UPI0026321B1E|nr:peptidoglycan DD-metalloendopeptidase family protein [Ferrovum sp.]
MKPVLRACFRAVLTGELILSVLWVGKGEASPGRDLHDLKKRIHQVEKDVATTEGSRQKVREELQRTEQTISVTTRQLHQLELQQTQLQAELGGLHLRSEDTQAEVSRQQRSLERWIQYRYYWQAGTPLPEALGVIHPDEWTRQAYYVDVLARHQTSKINELNGNLQALEEITRNRERKMQALARVETEMALQQKHLKEENATRAALMASLSSRLDSQRKNLESLRHDEARLTQLIDRLAREARRHAAIPPPHRAVSHRHVAPVAGESTVATIDQVPEVGTDESAFSHLRGHLRLPMAGELKNHFGSPRAETGLTWRGVFIHAPEGREVRAVAAGQVVYADWLRGFGNLLIIDHGDGYMSLYGGAQSFSARVGEKVQTGSVVASSGNTGENNESGLYFELRYQGKPIDPMRWVGSP